jgi:hypothetical protein
VGAFSSIISQAVAGKDVCWGQPASDTTIVARQQILADEERAVCEATYVCLFSQQTGRKCAIENDQGSMTFSKKMDPLVYKWDQNAYKPFGDFDESNNPITSDDGAGSCCGDDNSYEVPSTGYSGFCTTVASDASCQATNRPECENCQNAHPGASCYLTSLHLPDPLPAYICPPAGEEDATNKCYCSYPLNKKVYLDDPDMGKTSCEYCNLRNDPGLISARGKRNWTISSNVLIPQERRCCGDDYINADDLDNDCGYTFYDAARQDSYLCVKRDFDSSDANWRWRWENSTNWTGKIIDDTACVFNFSDTKYNFVGNSTHWIYCNQTYLSPGKYMDSFYRADTNTNEKNPLVITRGTTSHEFICQDNIIKECCGSTDADCISRVGDGTHHLVAGTIGTTPTPITIRNESGDPVIRYCSDLGTFFKEGEYDLSKYMCTGKGYGWSDVSGYCCGDDFNSYYQPAPNDKDSDGQIADCLNFSNGNLACVQESGKPDDTVLPGLPINCDEDPDNTCTLDNYLYPGCCKCPDPNADWPCQCTPVWCFKDEPPSSCSDPSQPKYYECTAEESYIGIVTYPPYTMTDPYDKDKWGWKNASHWPGYIYDISCANYKLVSNGTEWLSCTNFTLSNNETGFRLHNYPNLGAPNYIPDIYIDIPGSHTAKRYVTNPLLIKGRNQSNPSRISVNSHGYLCYEYFGQYSLVECCDPSISFNERYKGGYCNSLTSSTHTAYPGMSRNYFIPTSDGTAGQPITYYCKSDFSWSIDLDDDQAACEIAFGDGWTGTKCCGDSDDYPENYSDRGSTKGAACWNSVIRGEGALLEGNQILVSDGFLYGCNVTHNDTLSPFVTPDPQITNPLIIWDKQECETIKSSWNYYCDRATERWISIFDTVYVHAIVPGDPGNFSCCEERRCWNGQACVDSIEDNPESPSFMLNGKELRCRNGQWLPLRTIYTWDRKNMGFCFSDTQCLVSPSGTFNYDNNTYAYQGFSLGEKVDDWWASSVKRSPYCINDTQFIADNYCDMGNWTSRTKFIALQLLNFTKTFSITNYTLFCEDARDSFLFRPRAVNNLNYNIPFSYGGDIDNYLGASCRLQGGGFTTDNVLCANKICILKYFDSTNEYILFGTSLNAPINTPASSYHKSFLQVLGIEDNTFCDSALSSDYFRSCRTTGQGADTVYYNGKLQSVIFSRYNLDRDFDDKSIIKTSASWNAAFKEFLKSPIESLVTNILSRKPIIPPEKGEGFPMDLEFMQNTTKFNRLFIDVKPNGKRVVAINEKVRLYDDLTAYDEYIAINYTGFTSNICDTLVTFNAEGLSESDRGWYSTQGYSGESNEINCTKQGNSYYVVSKRPAKVPYEAEMETKSSSDYKGRYKWIGEDLWDELTQELRIQ